MTCAEVFSIRQNQAHLLNIHNELYDIENRLSIAHEAMEDNPKKEDLYKQLIRVSIAKDVIGESLDWLVKILDVTTWTEDE